MNAYLPGYQPDMARMLAARTAPERANLLIPHLTPGMRLLDLGCGPGAITAGLAAAVAPGVVLGLDLEMTQLKLVQAPIGLAAARAEALPIQSRSMDVAYAHALFEHLTEPTTVLAELRRILRPGGLLAVSSSDWSAAILEPHTADVETALRAYRRQRQQTGTDPDAGRNLAHHLRTAGFTVLAEQPASRIDMTYRDLACYLRDRLDDPEGARAAARWATAGTGRFVQCWVDVVARTP
jgi:SAM-dependent methyltransferase